MRNETSPTVTLHGVGRRFGDRIALTGVSAAIAPGEFVAIVGRSGAGKTTSLADASPGRFPSARARFVSAARMSPDSGAPCCAPTARGSA